MAPVDDSNLVALHGTVHPLAKPQYDQGQLSDSLPARRMLLLLQRPPQREAALQNFLRDVQDRHSPAYHQWLTPEDFGLRFGPADSDIQAAVSWLGSRGFSVARVTSSRTLIEFSGTAGQIAGAFHTQLHQYQVNGEMHYANATEINIPAALAPLVRGVTPLNDFARTKPYVHVSGPALYSRSLKKATPLWTIPNPYGTPNLSAYPVAPEDFATQYNLAPLYQAGLDGTGQTVGIINVSNIDLSVVSAYRQLFGLSTNLPQVVIDGNDPGTLNGVDVEAYLDVEVGGAVAPNANINLYISNGSGFQDPIALSALRAVEDNQASVLSASFGQCELWLGNGGNQFWSGLWEQAAAQGQTVFVASGDTGPQCNFGIGISVSGLASTPWNVAVGGTDFYYSDYASGGASAAALWNQTNTSNMGSLIAPLPEQVWNDPFGLNIIPNSIQRGEIFGGGGGASSCSARDASSGACLGGYAKPSWQAGPGVPADGVRDLPDVSLFASNGANLSAYPICAYPGECLSSAGAPPEVLLVGGTSASSPAMAGIMALVVQKYGRQGQANPIFYLLAQQAPGAFHDITVGNNNSPCFAAFPACSNGATTVYSAGPGYDLASGLGSVDANALVNSWNSTALLATTTKLTLSSRQIKHGTPITVTASVAPSSGSGTPSGDVAILTTSSLPSNQSQTFIPLTGGTGTQSVNFFPGGTYWVTGQYGGDPSYGRSTAPAVALTVTPENSTINFSVVDSQGQNISNSGTILYNSPMSLVVQPSGASAPAGKTNGIATGTATFTVDSTTATVALNSVGVASWMPPALAPGNHTAIATYSGDASFNASTGKQISFSVSKGIVYMTDYVDGPLPTAGTAPVIHVNTGGSLTITVLVGTFYGPRTGTTAPFGTVAPTGTVTICLGGNFLCWNPTYSQTVALNSPSGMYSQYATATATFTNLPPGDYVGAILYNGDANWQSQQLDDARLEDIQVGPPAALASSSTALSVSPASISGTQLVTIHATVTGNSGAVPTGEIDYYNNGVFLAYQFLYPTGVTTSEASFLANSSWFWNNGANQITAIYDGDSNYLASVSSVANLNVTQLGGDFSLAPQSPQVTVGAGTSGAVALNLASLNQFNGIVTLACAPSSTQIGCNVSPSSVNVNGAATATLTVTVVGHSASAFSRYSLWQLVTWLNLGGGAGLFAAVVLCGFGERQRRLTALFSIALFAMLLVTPGCGGSSASGAHGTPPPTPPNPNAYTVTVTATTNGIIHSATLTVLVQ